MSFFLGTMVSPFSSFDVTNDLPRDSAHSSSFLVSSSTAAPFFPNGSFGGSGRNSALAISERSTLLNASTTCEQLKCVQCNVGTVSRYKMVCFDPSLLVWKPTPGQATKKPPFSGEGRSSPSNLNAICSRELTSADVGGTAVVLARGNGSAGGKISLPSILTHRSGSYVKK